MATPADMARALTDLIKSTGNTSKYAKMLPVLMGWKTGAASWDFDVSGPAGWKFVTIMAGSTRVQPIRVLNPDSIADSGDLALWIDINKSGQPYIYDLREVGY